MNIVALVIGMLIAVVVILRFRTRRLEQTRWAYPLLLASFSIYYWIFAIYAGDFTALIKELTASILFLSAAYLAYRFKSFTTLLLLAGGYIAHAAYDIYHHMLFSNPGTPNWWPELCGTVDLLIGGYIAYIALTLPKTLTCANTVTK